MDHAGIGSLQYRSDVLQVIRAIHFADLIGLACRNSLKISHGTGGHAIGLRNDLEFRLRLGVKAYPSVF